MTSAAPQLETLAPVICLARVRLIRLHAPAMPMAEVALRATLGPEDLAKRSKQAIRPDKPVCFACGQRRATCEDIHQSGRNTVRWLLCDSCADAAAERAKQGAQ